MIERGQLDSMLERIVRLEKRDKALTTIVRLLMVNDREYYFVSSQAEMMDNARKILNDTE